VGDETKIQTPGPVSVETPTGRVQLEPGSMGLQGWLWKNVGNASGMAIIAVMMLWLYVDLRSSLRSMHAEDREDLIEARKQHAAERERDRESRIKQSQRITDLTSKIDALSSKADQVQQTFGAIVRFITDVSKMMKDGEG